MASRGSSNFASISLFSIGLTTSGERPLHSGHEIQPQGRVPVGFLIALVEGVAQVAIDNHARAHAIVQVDAEIDEAGITEEAGGGAEVGLHVEHIAAQVSGQVSLQAAIDKGGNECPGMPGPADQLLAYPEIVGRESA